MLVQELCFAVFDWFLSGKRSNNKQSEVKAMLTEVITAGSTVHMHHLYFLHLIIN